MFDILTRHGASAADDYEIGRSLRHNSAASEYLSRTPSSSTNRTTFTFSFWTKFVASNYSGAVFGVWQDNTSRDTIRFLSGQINLQCGQHSENAQTDAEFLDTSAWYHIVVAVDSTQAASADRVVIYVNGISQALGTNTISQDREFKINTDNIHVIGCRWLSGAYDSGFNGYLAEFHFIDGSKLAPSSFGETSTITGQWIPKKYGGSYGTNGYYLDFADNSGTTATTLGKDSSGNGNNFTPNNYSVAANSDNDSVIDTPTDNFCTLNSRYPDTGSGNWPSHGLLWGGTADTAGWRHRMCTIALPSTGKWYWECKIPDAGADASNGYMTGIAYPITFTSTQDVNSDSTGMYGRQGTEKYLNDSSNPVDSDFTSVSDNDILQYAYDADGEKLYTGKNNTWEESANPSTGSNPNWTSVAAGAIPFVGSYGNNLRVLVNFGQQGFIYTPPTGYKTLSTANLPDPTIKNPSKYFNTGTYTGTGSSNAITGLGFQPDHVIIKMRNTANQDFQNFDAVRGANKVLRWNTQETSDTQTTRFTSFDSDGFTVGTENITNQSSKNFVYWAWKEDATAGFDMVKYTGNGSSPRTVSHSLGVVPELYIIKNMETNSTIWVVGNKTLDADENVFISSADDDENAVNYWASTRPTSSVFTVNDNDAVNKNGDEHIAYLWASVEGMCKVGNYTGNGSNHGAFVHLGFRPSFFMVKNTNDNEHWGIYDDARNYNPDNPYLVPSGYNNGVELSDRDLDLLSNGIKFRSSHNMINANENGSAYIYLAMARSPFKYANAR